MKFGFCLPHDGELSKPEKLTELSHHAERLDFERLIEPSDHLVMPNKIDAIYPYSPSGDYADTREDLDQLTTLAFVAAKTEKIRLMTGISVIPYRSPFSLANSFATLDHLSNGRLDIGAGVGWMKQEFDLLHVPYDQRGEIMDEYLKILKVIWSENNPRFSGKYFQFSDVHFSPKVVQKPHPPIWVGGESPRAIRRAATLGDGWLPIDVNTRFPLLTTSQMADSIARLRNEMEKAGRRPDEVRIGYLSQSFEMNENPVETRLLAGKPQKIVSDIEKLAALGISFIGLNFLREDLEKSTDYAERFAEEVMKDL